MADYILLKKAEKFLLKLPTNEQIRIIQALDNFTYHKQKFRT